MSETFSHKKSLGQHFLNSDIVPTWMCDAAAVTTGDTVVEIGPGTGVLTRALLARGARVFAIETDRRAITILETEFATELTNKQLTLITADARKLNLQDLGLTDHGFKIVANIPYYLSGHLFRTCLETAVQPSDLVFLVQKEVAKRAAAKLPPAPRAKGSLLALSLQAYGDVSIYRAVSRGHFTPVPNVDSAIVAVRNISRTFFNELSEATFFATIRAGFAQKRKQLRPNLTTTFSASAAEAALAASDITPTIRAEDLSLEQWQQLATVIQAYSQERP